jgi:two-component system nitrogen regulation sensor histidine kinase NtrY
MKRLSRVLSVLLIFMALGSIIMTYISLGRGDDPLGPDPQTALKLILINLVLLLAVVAMVARRAYRLLTEMKSGSVGSRLQTRIVAMFSLVAIVPAIIVSVFSAVFFNFGIQSWFNDKVSNGLESSVAVAEAYLKEHQEIIRTDITAMSRDLERELYLADINPKRFQQIVSTQALLRSLTEAIVFQRNRIIAKSDFSFSIAFERLSPDELERAQNGEVVISTSDSEDKVRALIQLDPVTDTFLLVGRLVDPKVIGFMENAQGSVNEYRRLQTQISDLQIKFSIVFVLVSLLLLLLAIWAGMQFASRLMLPIVRLIGAAERVRVGDFTARVHEGPTNDELATLGRAFNRMTSQLEMQRTELVRANELIDSRRRFTEAVLAGVSAGVVALDSFHGISLFNRSAAALLTLPEDAALRNLPIEDVVPELGELLAEVEARPEKMAQRQISFVQKDRTLFLNVRVTAERLDGQIEGYIATFDDITELMAAQRTAAWADVARRVAHEIKNPLTPIQLASERIKRKYTKLVGSEEGENLGRYVDTILRHVGDIRHMVEEFVSFARMPTPKIREENLTEIVRKSLFSEQNSNPEIAYTANLKEEIHLACDGVQMGQVLTNLLQNAAQSLLPEGEEFTLLPEGGRHIWLDLHREADECLLTIQDNGPGFPPDKLHRVLEPYYTTRSKGTGLGLAIVKKIVEDHGGNLMLANREEGGARIVIRLPLHLPVKC